MPRYIATVHVVLDADDQAHACEKLGKSLNDLMVSPTRGGPWPIHTWAYVNYPGYRYALDGSAYMGPVPVPPEAPSDLRYQNLTSLAPVDPVREDLQETVENLTRLLDAYATSGRDTIAWINLCKGGVAARAALSRAQKKIVPKVGTPCSRWKAEGQPDPHGEEFNGDRATIAMGQVSDDALVDALMRCDHKTSLKSMGLLTAGKERIRWLSRAVERAVSEEESERLTFERAALAMGELTDDVLANAIYMYDHRSGEESAKFINAAVERIRWLSNTLDRATEPAAAPETTN
jgi:hypothetical protein